MVSTVSEKHARLYALHGSPSEVVTFHKAIARRLKALGVSAEQFEPFAGEGHDAHTFDTNARAMLDWAAAVSPPEKTDHPHAADQKKANCELLGRLGATLTARFGPAVI